MLGWIALALLVAYGASRVLLGYPRPERSLTTLTRAEVAFLAAAAEATFPPGGAIPESGLDADVPGYTDRYLAASHPRMRWLMRCLFFLVEHATLLFPAAGWTGFRRFSSLTPEQRSHALERWARSRFFARRLVFASLRAVLMMGYVAHPPVMRRLGLTPYAIPSPVGEPDLIYPPIGQPPEAIAYGPDDRTPPSDGTPLPLDSPLDPRYAGGAA